MRPPEVGPRAPRLSSLPRLKALGSSFGLRIASGRGPEGCCRVAGGGDADDASGGPPKPEPDSQPPPKQRQSWPTNAHQAIPSAGDNLDAVQRCFEQFTASCRLQHLCACALLNCGANICIAAWFAFAASGADLVVVGDDNVGSSFAKSNSNNSLQDSGPDFDLTHETDFEIDAAATTPISKNHYRDRKQAEQRQAASNAHHGLGATVGAIFGILALCALVARAHINQRSGRAKSDKWSRFASLALEATSLAFSSAALCAPLAFAAGAANFRSLDVDSPLPQTIQLHAVVVAALVTALPAALAPSSVRRYALLAAALLAPLAVLATTVWRTTTTTSTGPILLLLGIALGAGLARRMQLEQATRARTFAGAGELVDAKVALEHQRQQQETLLLSVLPAYVAERVKRSMMLGASTAGGGSGASWFGAGTSSRSLEPPPVHASLSSLKPSATSHLLAAASIASSAASLLRAAATSASCDEPNTASHAHKHNHNQPNQQHLHQHQQHQYQQQHQHQHQQQLQHQQDNSRRGFNELYIKTHHNVTLLYGDIVGFTALCSELSSFELVSLLSDLFTHFDSLALKHKIMRIKILGDCYYGVSGIPEFATFGQKTRASCNENHALNCVNMALDMIAHIESLDFRTINNNCNNNDQTQQQNINKLNMRIGIHTGHVHSGVIGLKKWQFDIWSNDASIAMHCESSGAAGRVHLTDTTVALLATCGRFQFEEAGGASRDSFLAANNVKTYFVIPLTSLFSFSAESIKSSAATTPTFSKLPLAAEQTQLAAAADDARIRAATISTLRQTLLPAGDALAALGLSHPDLRKLTLRFREKPGSPVSSGIGESLESTVRIELFAIAVGQLLVTPVVWSCCGFFLFSGTDSINGSINIAAVGVLVAHLAFTVVLLLFATINCVCFNGEATKRLRSRQHQNNQDQHLQDTVVRLQVPSLNTTTTRFVDFDTNYYATTTTSRAKPLFAFKVSARTKVAAFLIFASNVAAQLLCAMQQQQSCQQQSTMVAVNCMLLASIALLSTLCFVVELLNSAIKLALIVAQLVVVVFVAGGVNASQLFKNCSPSYNITNLNHSDIEPELNLRDANQVQINETAAAAAALALAFSLALLAYLSARADEILAKSNLLWRNKLKVDSEELEYLFGLNKVLLENILPCHVVQYMMTKQEEGRNCPPCESTAAEVECSPQLISFNRKASGSGSSSVTPAQYQQRRRLTRCSTTTASTSTSITAQKATINSVHAPTKAAAASTSPGDQQHNYPSQNSISSATASFARAFGIGHHTELYHEQHEFVAVMFASIPHFYEFYDESDISKQGLGCIALLNEIVCDFDKLLLKNKFSRIEKIKTIGSTYMAAAGLRPSISVVRANSTSSSPGAAPTCNNQQTVVISNNDRHFGIKVNALQSASFKASLALISENSAQISTAPLVAARQQQPDAASAAVHKANLICIIQFATSLMCALNSINRQSFQSFKLRIGVHSGQVIAGVVGTQRPFYDIWGDCVNIASRMETSGQVGRIQIEQSTARILLDSLSSEVYSITRRGLIDVKGKGEMVTYFVDPSRGVDATATSSQSLCSLPTQQVTTNILTQTNSHSLSVKETTSSKNNINNSNKNEQQSLRRL